MIPVLILHLIKMENHNVSMVLTTGGLITFILALSSSGIKSLDLISDSTKISPAQPAHTTRFQGKYLGCQGDNTGVYLQIM